MEGSLSLGSGARGRGPVLRRRFGELVIRLALALYALVTLYPLIWLFLSAFKTNDEFHSKPFGLPGQWSFDNFGRAWEVSAMGTSIVNSLLVTVLALVLTLVFGALAAFALARFEFRLKGFWMGLFLLGMLIPVHSTLVPLFILMKKTNLLDTYAALVLPYAAFELPLAVFVIAAFLTSIPKEIEEAALIDGTGYWGIFLRMMLPLSLPALSTVAILGFLRFWNDFAFALVFISKPALKTVPLSLSVFATGYSTDYKLTMAALSIAVLPTILAFLLFQEQIMKGMTAGAVKG
ncbi:carbohydrate ABC transporter permease [Paenibacillus mucilaginosus]|uniref:Binding-protein-dependent transport systems inner membrane component n=3 Tax=Paenibacillus mucilaginosus TaxID=61624 RepID=H6NKM2_9BACL|nr:carbohydrate ABC transporter permease [Paenibacillus mucilaginosus]AEI45449.1 binding-protein-dependent transport systems inner membrane component [Paenibacillus mucilaginosus KNP414]AFC33159.1 binding-protein-dependent transport systems inner membrane component [Paenibacillus mucilaginosus 3016]AFH65472.1 ABC transporter permease [Paenibacillus mucilaginosus K02]MCG7215210.1 carbohydrate ABC transporter permease [Paenibacillus mucilaginosus]WDM26880.1 carbohydrate ABC transporter permease 